MTNPFELASSIEQGRQDKSGAGYTVWRHRGRQVGERWFLAHSSQDAAAARAVFEQLARRSQWGCVRLLDPAGRELAVVVGRVGQ